MEFEEKLFDTKDMRPINQLKAVSERYMNDDCSQMFNLSHKDTLRKYVDKNKEFKGEILFHKGNVFLFHTQNNIETQECQSMYIQQVSLADKLDYLPDGDIDDEKCQLVSAPKEVKQILIMAGTAGSPKSPPKSPSKNAKTPD